MTWTTLVLSYSPLKIELVGTLALRAVMWLVPSLLFLLFDTTIPSLSESIKIYGSSSLPRRNAPALVRTLLLALANLLLFTTVQAAFSVAVAMLLKRPLLTTSTTLPLPWQMIKHIVWLYMSREVLTYYIHRYILHSRGMLADLHRNYGHSHRGAPYSLMVYVDHPLPLLLHRLLPTYLPALAIRPHLLTYFVFIALTTLEEMQAMSGYNIIPGIILRGITRRTAAHYMSRGKGNYGAWGLMDWVNGTTVGQDAIEDIQDEAEKHQVKERSKSAANEFGNAVKEGINGFKKNRKRGSKKASTP